MTACPRHHPRPRFRPVAAGLAVLVVVALCGPAVAELRGPSEAGAITPAKQVIEARREQMKRLGGHMRAVIDYIKGGPATIEEIAARTAKIRSIADEIPAMFPEGTAMVLARGAATGAKPEIWLEPAKFAAMASTFSMAAGKLHELTGNGDRRAMAQQFMLVGRDGCSGCHELYRHKLPGTD